MPDSTDAIVLEHVVKRFRKSTIRNEYTTFKSELVRWLRGQRQQAEKRLIEALRGVDLRIPRGSTTAILGRNGSGKSTLLKLITGIYRPTGGSIQVNGRISALLDLGAGFHPDFSGRENILINGIILGMSRAQVRARMEEIIAFSELGEFIDEPVRTYSSGMYARLAFSVATHVDPDILIIDEILAVGDEHFSKKSQAKMMDFKRAGKTIVLVTHDLGAVERWCDLAVWMDAGRVRRVGSPAEVAAEYRQAVALAEQRHVALGPAALAGEEAALPEVDSSTSAQAGAAPAVEVRRVWLMDEAGQPVQVVTPEQSVAVCIEYEVRQQPEGLEFEVVLTGADDKELYATSTRIDGVKLPQRLRPQGRLRLVLERVGVLSGDYTLQVVARTPQGPLGPVVPCTFSVRSERADRGLFRVAHQWVVEEEPASQPRLEAIQ